MSEQRPNNKTIKFEEKTRGTGLLSGKSHDLFLVSATVDKAGDDPK
jgi:hypothetical protein